MFVFAWVPLCLDPPPYAALGLAVLLGMAFGALLTCAYQVVAELALPGTVVEAYGSLIAAFGLGQALGTAAAGPLAGGVGPPSRRGRACPPSRCPGLQAPRAPYGRRPLPLPVAREAVMITHTPSSRPASHLDRVLAASHAEARAALGLYLPLGCPTRAASLDALHLIGQSADGLEIGAPHTAPVLDGQP
ncbi:MULTISPECIES: tryptophan synthase subunit alpha [unclassified Streptomyces]|uniref:tryptophan synthase subunit alpha n=1 Tax=unclassified Streptomyces TaxID=2593676 RepID=UPI000A6105B5|nr:tryptophan synthase subunit alpha [Streptomyces sp. TSRI0107]